MSRSNSSRRRKNAGLAPPWIHVACASGKKRYASRHLAREHLRRLRGLGDKRPRKLNTYHCASCGDWHVGHSSR
jgi:hypothetical protein